MEHFKYRIIVSNVSGRKKIVCLSDTAHQENYTKTEKIRIVLPAADIIEEAIQNMAYNYHIYPDTNDIKSG
ncbi:hypothetical protein PR048_015811, partial [Dryococelus australis]